MVWNDLSQCGRRSASWPSLRGFGGGGERRLRDIAPPRPDLHAAPRAAGAGIGAEQAVVARHDQLERDRALGRRGAHATAGRSQTITAHALRTDGRHHDSAGAEIREQLQNGLGSALLRQDDERRLGGRGELSFELQR